MFFKKQREFFGTALLNPILSNTSLMIFSVGVLAILVSAAELKGLPENYGKLLAQLGWAMLGAGVFAGVMKSAQFSELFQKHIADVIYDPSRAENQDVLLEKWRLLTDARVKRLLPSTYSKAVAGIEHRFFNNELHYHFEAFQMSYTISVTNGTAEITNTMHAALRIPKHIDDPVFRQNIRVDTPAKLTTIFINSKKIDLDDPTLFVGEGDSRELVLHLRKFAKGADSVVIERTFAMTQNLVSEPFISAVVSRYIKGAVIKGKITPGHKLRFIGMGIDPIEKETTDGEGYTKWRLAAPDDLLLPGQGYMLIIVSV